MSTTREFTKEQLIAKAREQIAFCRHTKITGEGRTHVNQCSALFEIALAALTAEPVKYAANGSLFSQIEAAEVTARSYGVPVEPLYHLPIEGLK